MKSNTTNNRISFLFFCFLALILVSCEKMRHAQPSTEFLTRSDSKTPQLNSGGSAYSIERNEEQTWAKACDEILCLEYHFETTSEGFAKPITYQINIVAKENISNLSISENWFPPESVEIKSIKAPLNAQTITKKSPLLQLAWSIDLDANETYTFINTVSFIRGTIPTDPYHHVTADFSASRPFFEPLTITRSIHLDEDGIEIPCSTYKTLEATHVWFYGLTEIPDSWQIDTPTPQPGINPTPTYGRKPTLNPYPIEPTSTPNSREGNPLYP